MINRVINRFTNDVMGGGVHPAPDPRRHEIPGLYRFKAKLNEVVDSNIMAIASEPNE